jgi:hypothetical protein
VRVGPAVLKAHFSIKRLHCIASLSVDANLLASGRTGTSRAKRIIAITNSARLFDLILAEGERQPSRNQGNGCDETKLLRVAHGIFLNK